MNSTRHERWRAQWKLNWRMEQTSRSLMQVSKAARNADIQLGWLEIPPAIRICWPFPLFGNYRARPYDWAFDLPRKELNDENDSQN